MRVCNPDRRYRRAGEERQVEAGCCRGAMAWHIFDIESEAFGEV